MAPYMSLESPDPGSRSTSGYFCRFASSRRHAGSLSRSHTSSSNPANRSAGSPAAAACSPYQAATGGVMYGSAAAGHAPRRLSTGRKAETTTRRCAVRPVGSRGSRREVSVRAWTFMATEKGPVGPGTRTALERADRHARGRRRSMVMDGCAKRCEGGECGGLKM